MKRSDVEQKVAECYSTWGSSYYEEYYGPNAPYPPVHLEIIQQLVRQLKPKSILDAGCGPASMLRGLDGIVRERFGFDLTPEMVSEARRIFEEQDDDPSRIWKGSVLNARSFLSTRSKRFSPYPMVLCSGVLPHIGAADDKKVFKNLYTALKRGGVAVIEGRNELFSLFTMNRYSHDFFCDRLLRLEEWKKRDPKLKKKITAVQRDMERGFTMDQPPLRKGKKGEPGYDEVLSRLHNPLIVAEQLKDVGFSNVEFIFYHYHCVPPQFRHALGESFIPESLAMEGTKDWRGYFMASAFLAIATR